MNQENQGNPILEDAAFSSAPATTVAQPTKFEMGMHLLLQLMGEDKRASAALLDSKPVKVHSNIIVETVERMLETQKKATQEKVEKGIESIIAAKTKMAEAKKAFLKAEKEAEEAILKEINNLSNMVSDIEIQKKAMLEAMSGQQ